MIIQLLHNNTSLVSLYRSESPSIILMQNGVYAASNLLNTFPEHTVYALLADWQASGLPELSKVKLISPQEWVELCACNKPVITLQDAN